MKDESAGGTHAQHLHTLLLLRQTKISCPLHYRRSLRQLKPLKKYLLILSLFDI